ncbi:MAG TPA: 2-C-methyl-D-erythritol 2,4-cyclodiphosphate synthase [Candidatus Limnocylindrales bacterium]|nr:2-C-methyl-D-erythritol 2,4-cyclodiphosphate synthase [Candidatus Limnocylindrales bacterium]
MSGSSTAHARPRADAIVVAAGSSSRMGGLDKLAWTVAGRPLLAYTLDGLASASEVESIIVVTAAERRASLAAAAWLPAKVRAVVAGGSRRQDSVAAGFAALEAIVPDTAGDRIVLVHDGARPVIGADLVTAVTAAADRHGAAIPVLPVVETVKRLDGDVIAETVDRSTLAAAQTPQGVRRALWRTALANPVAADGTWTDEAALLEACRIPVHAIPGEPANLKVTLPDDLRRVERALAPASVRVGLGHDSHPFGPGTGLRLGGIEIPGAPRLAGHSDGDVVLHAVADALLGAAGQGDLGRLFPADARTPKGVASEALLREVVARVAAVGLVPAGVDVVVIGARPRLGVRLDEMRDAIAALLDLAPHAVNVKASTGNLAGDEGAGRSVSAQAVATLRVGG